MVYPGSRWLAATGWISFRRAADCAGVVGVDIDRQVLRRAMVCECAPVIEVSLWSRRARVVGRVWVGSPLWVWDAAASGVRLRHGSRGEPCAHVRVMRTLRIGRASDVRIVRCAAGVVGRSAAPTSQESRPGGVCHSAGITTSSTSTIAESSCALCCALFCLLSCQAPESQLHLSAPASPLALLAPILISIHRRYIAADTSVMRVRLLRAPPNGLDGQ